MVGFCDFWNNRIFRHGLTATVIALSAGAAAHAETPTILHAFKGPKDGAQPYAGLMLDKKGDLYGTAQNQGKGGDGTIFKITAGRFKALYSFDGGTGEAPSGTLIADKQGNIYGATEFGGDHG